MGMLNCTMTPETERRFWQRVSVGRLGACWPWQRHIKTTGYGQFSKNLSAHRVAWESARGPIPDGLHVLHRCDNRKCCNPAHLFLGTNSDNMADKLAKSRHRWGNCRGEEHGRAKLNEEKVRRIRTLYAYGMTLKQLAAEFDIDFTSIWAVVRRKSWAHVPDEEPN